MLTEEQALHNLNNKVQQELDDKEYRLHLEERRLNEIRFRAEHPEASEFHKQMAGITFVNKRTRVYIEYVD